MVEKTKIPETQKTYSLWGRAMTLVILLAGCATAYWLGTHIGVYPLPNGGLVVEDKYLNFGEVWEDSKFSWKLPIRNAGPKEVEILDFGTSCACGSIQPRSFTLGPGEAREVDLTLDLARFMPAKPSWDWPFETTIVPQVKGQPAQQKGWALRGQIKKLLDISPAVVSFGEELTHGQPFPTKTVQVLASEPLADLLADCDGQKVLVKVGQQGAGKFELAISPHPNLGAGPFQMNIFLQPVKGKGEKLPGKTLRAEGLVQEEIEFIPSSVLLGALTLGETVSETITFFSRTGHHFKVEKWKTSTASTKVEPRKFKGSGDFRITQKVTKIGNQSNQVIFLIRSKEKMVEVKLEISYYGLGRN